MWAPQWPAPCSRMPSGSPSGRACNSSWQKWPSVPPPRTRCARIEGLLTTDAISIVTDPSIDVIVEVIGGISPTRDLVLQAFGRKAVVTANKELLANHGAELWDAASAAGVDLLFEASVAGGIPLIRALQNRSRASDSTA